MRSLRIEKSNVFIERKKITYPKNLVLLTLPKYYNYIMAIYSRKIIHQEIKDQSLLEYKVRIIHFNRDGNIQICTI